MNEPAFEEPPKHEDMGEIPPPLEPPPLLEPPPPMDEPPPRQEVKNDDGELPAHRPVWSNEAEQSVLGAVMLDNSVLDPVTEILVAEDFYVGAHRLIYQTMMTLLERGEPADPVLLQQHLVKNEALESMGGAGYLARLMNTVPATTNAVAYAHLVRDKSILRNLLRETTGIAESIHRSKARQVDEILDEAEQRIFAVGETRSQRGSNYYDMKSILVPVIAQIEELKARGEAVTGVSTGFVDLDKIMAGMQGSDLIIIAGRPAMGKTSFVMNIATNAAMEHNAPVAVFSLEMSKEQLVTRMLSSTARIDANRLRTGHIEEKDYSRLIQVSDVLMKAPVFVDDTPALSILSLRSKARRLKREKNIQVLIVDYLQLMRGEGDVENRVQEISQISRGLKAIAKELNIPVLALSQLSRKLEERPDKRPILSDLRESGAIEQDADLVLFVFREEVYKEGDPALQGIAEILIRKQRNGPTGTVKLTFTKQFTRFDNHAPSSY